MIGRNNKTKSPHYRLVHRIGYLKGNNRIKMWIEDSNLIKMVVFIGTALALGMSATIAYLDDGFGSKMCSHHSTKDLEIIYAYQVEPFDQLRCAKLD